MHEGYCLMRCECCLRARVSVIDVIPVCVEESVDRNIYIYIYIHVLRSKIV
jgi:hypothetical protein